MNIDQLDLIAYGHLTDVSIDLSGQPRRFHIIMGRNEWGKSTSMRAIHAWLFGFPGQTADDYVHSMRSLRVGGILRSGEQTLHCVRRKGRQKTLLDGKAPDTPINEEKLHAMLGNVDRDTFSNQFLIDHDELISGGQMVLRGEGELGEILFAAGAGLGQLKRIREELVAQQEELFKARGKSRLGESFKAIKQLKSQIKAAQIPPADYADLQRHLSEQQASLDRLKQTRQTLDDQQHRLKTQIDALPLIPRLQLAQAELEAFAKAPLLPVDFSERRREAVTSIQVVQEKVDQLIQRRNEITGQLHSIVLEPAVLQRRDLIESLVRELPLREKGESERQGVLKSTLRSQERELRERLGELAQAVCDREVQSFPQNVQPETPESDDELSAQVEQFELTETQRGKVGRLAARYATLTTELEEAERQVQKLEHRLDEARQRQPERDPQLVPNSLTRLLESMEPPEKLAQSLAESKAACEQWQSLCSATVGRLELSQSVDEASRIQPPDPQAISDAAAAMSQADDKFHDEQRQLDLLSKRLADEKINLDAIESGVELPTTVQLNETRQHRDRILEALSGGKSDSSELHTLAQWIHQADQIADQLRIHQQAIATREAAQANLRKLKAQVERSEDELQNFQSHQQACLLRWNQLWEDAGIPPKSPAAMVRWVDDLAKLQEQFAELLSAQSRQSQSRQAVETAIKRLRGAVHPTDGPSDTSDDPVADLVKLYELAISRRDQQEQASRDQESLLKQMEAWKLDLVDAKALVTQRSEAIAKWQQAWVEATQSLQSASPAPDDVMPMLEAIKDLGRLKKEREEMRHRIASIENETAVFVKTVSRLITELNDNQEKSDRHTASSDQEDSPIQSRFDQTIACVDALAKRLGQAVQSHEEHRRINADVARLDAELSSAQEDLKRHLVLAEQLCREAGCQSVDRLPEMEQLAHRRDKITQQIREYEVQLKLLAGDQPVDQLIESTSNVQMGMLENQLRQIESEIKQNNQQLENTQQQLGAIHQQLSQIDGGANAASLNQDLAEMQGELADDASQYIRLRLASGILREAIEHYRSENQQPVLMIAEKYFSKLTCGDYAGLKVDFDNRDLPSLHGVRSGHDAVPAHRMSKGTADALYLSLRLASLEHRCRQGHPMPLIVDDCLQQLDNPRAVAAMRAFSELSLQTQVIMFTHHEHLVDLAAEHMGSDDVHTHVLN